MKNVYKYIHKSQEFFFNAFIIITYFFYVAVAIGLLPTFPSYLNNLNTFIHIYICFFLLYRFNPFRKIKCTELDRKIVFSSGLLLFTTFVLNSKTISYLQKLFPFLQNLF
jgi:hypothetical protein